MSPRRSLVTGAAGFIGSHLVSRLVARGDEVHVVVRPETAFDRLRGVTGAIVVHKLNLADGPALSDCLNAAAPEHVYHLATQTRASAEPGFDTALRTIREDQANLITLLATMANMPVPPAAFVRTGTIAEYGRAPLPYREYEREEPVSPYGASMVAGTHYIQMLEAVLPFPVITARLALVYGAGQSEEFLVPALIRACLEGRNMLVRRPCDRRDLLYIDDAVDALVRLAENPPPGCSILNIATGTAPTMREVAGLVIAATGADPSLVEFDEMGSAAGESELRAATGRAKALIGWSAAMPLDKGIARTVAAMSRSPAIAA